MNEMLDRRQGGTMPSGTPVLVLAVHDNPLLTKLPVVEARVTGGKSKGLKIYLHAQNVSRPVTKPAPRTPSRHP